MTKIILFILLAWFLVGLVGWTVFVPIIFPKP